MTKDTIESAFTEAAGDFNESLAVMRPHRNESEGYCEANLMDYFSHALRKYGFRPFLELPIARGCRVDGLFFHDSTFLLTEAKQLYYESVPDIKADLERLALLDLRALLSSYGLATAVTEVFEIAICDCWSDNERRRWTDNTPPCSFLAGYTASAVKVPRGHHIVPYTWLLAYRERAMSLSS